MKKQLLFLSIFFVVSVKFYSQQSTFQQAFQRNTSMAYGGQQTHDGGFIMAGLVSVNSTNYDYLAVKTNASGDTLWSKTYGGIGDEESYAMQQTTDKGFIFAGIDSSSGLGNYNVYLVKTDSLGDTLWTRSYGGSNADFAQAIQQTADGGYIVAGYTSSFGAGNADVYLLKTDANGTLTWSKTYGGSLGDYGYAVKQTADGGYIIAGATSTFGMTTDGNYNDFYLIKTNSSGVLIWSKTYGKYGDDWAYGVLQTSDGGYAVTGHCQKDSLDVGTELCLLKTDASGNTLFSESLGGTNYDKGTCILQNNKDSSLVIGGSSYSYGSGASDFYFIITNKAGTVLQKSTIGGIGNDWAYAINQSNDHGFILSGYTDNFGVDSSSFYLVKLDSIGHTNSCNQTNPNPTISYSVLVTNNPATVSNSPATKTANNTHTAMHRGVKSIPVCAYTTGGLASKRETQTNYSLFPNPGTGAFNLLSSQLTENTQLSVYNQLGQLVLQKNITQTLNTFTLDVSAGVYMVRVTSGAELVYQTKLIKE